MNIEAIAKPTLLLDQDICQRNILHLIRKTAAQGVALRPHFKTHQSGFIAEWFRALGVDKITVSSMGMARYFTRYGWQDITVAFPVNIREINTIKTLSAKIHLGLLVVDRDTVEVLGENTNHSISIWIKIDVGTHRTGIDPQRHAEISEILYQIDRFPHLRFSGFLAHAGHSYQKRDIHNVQSVYQDSLQILLALKSKFSSKYPHLQISLGDTPGASMVEEYGEVDELRPGNFVFYDLMQQQIGACRFEEIAVALACPVVATHPERNQWIIYGGAIHFSKDYLIGKEGHKLFGIMADIREDGWSVKNSDSNPVLISLSQEHGIVQCSEETFNLCKPGDISLWLPVHSCLTADAIGAYVTTKGDVLDHYREHRFD